MPKPKGWSSERAAKRDRLAKKLEHQPDVENPWAVATAAVKPRKKKKR